MIENLDLGRYVWRVSAFNAEKWANVLLWNRCFPEESVVCYIYPPNRAKTTVLASLFKSHIWETVAQLHWLPLSSLSKSWQIPEHLLLVLAYPRVNTFHLRFITFSTSGYENTGKELTQAFFPLVTASGISTETCGLLWPSVWVFRNIIFGVLMKNLVIMARRGSLITLGVGLGLGNCLSSFALGFACDSGH